MTNIKNGQVISWLLSFVKPLRLKVFGAVLLGIISNLSVVLITFLGVKQMLEIINHNNAHVWRTFWSLILCGIVRGFSRYLEQYLNHDIAFSLLANVRANIFKVLRKLGPARLTGKNSGDLITAITTDVEALEVFFAHTISPVFIALGTSMILTIYFTYIHVLLGIILLLGHLFVGVLVPIVSYKQHEKTAFNFQETFVDLNQAVMENVESIREVNQFSLVDKKLTQLTQIGQKLNTEYRKKLRQSSSIQILSEFGLLVTTIAILLTGIFLELPYNNIILSSVLALSSFGGVFALSGLGNALLSTFASGKRLFSLVNEKPNVTFINTSSNQLTDFKQLSIEELTFSYGQKNVFDGFNLELLKGKMLGIGGESGSGKSTLLKLLMRYWDPEKGKIMVNYLVLTQMPEAELHKMEGVMEQKTFIFAGTIGMNISLGKTNATQEEIELAAKAAALTDWIESLPEKYETKIGGNFREVSDGERQRIGLSRVFLHDAPLLLLDEPTSSLDYINEQKIVSTIKEVSHGKTTIIVSHRASTLAIADETIIIE